MKKLIVIIWCLMFNIYPLKVGFTQTTQPTTTSTGAKEADLKDKIAANIDTALTNIARSKNIIQKKPEPIKKPHTKYKVITEIVYIDTCYDKAPTIIQQLPVTIEKPQLTVMKKQNFFQRLFGRKKKPI